MVERIVKETKTSQEIRKEAQQVQFCVINGDREEWTI